MSYQRGDVVLVDTNLFVSVGGVDHPKFRKLREFAEHRQFTLLVPQRVQQELSTMHIAHRVERAVDDGQPNERSNGKASAAGSLSSDYLGDTSREQ